MIEPLFFLADISEAMSDLAGRFGIKWQVLFAQGVNFLIVIFLLWKFAFKPIVATIDERQKTIADGLRYTEEMKVKLAEAEQKHDEIIRKASQEAGTIIQEARQTAKDFAERQARETAERTEQMLAKARETIEMERKKMLAEVRAEIARLVVATTSRVLSRDLSDQERSRYLESASREIDGGRN